jgi:hypothetical protein
LASHVIGQQMLLIGALELGKELGRSRNSLARGNLCEARWQRCGDADRSFHAAFPGAHGVVGSP